MIEVFVEGRAAPKGSRIQARTKAGKSYTYPASRFEKPWTDAVKSQVQVAVRHASMRPPYAVELEFVAERPRQPKQPWPTASDLDKLERCVLDGLVQAKAITDDRHVTALTSRKRFGAPGERQGVYLRISEDRNFQELPVAI